MRPGTGADDGRLLKNGDVVAFGITRTSTNEPLNDGTFEYEEGQDLRYTFHQFTESGPPEMTEKEKEIRSALDLLDREHLNINVQRRILSVEKSFSSFTLCSPIGCSNSYLHPEAEKERPLFNVSKPGAGVKLEHDIKPEPQDSLPSMTSRFATAGFFAAEMIQMTACGHSALATCLTSI